MSIFFSKKPKTYKIRKDKNDFVLINNNKEFVYKNILELIAAYKNPEETLFLQERLPPSDYGEFYNAFFFTISFLKYGFVTEKSQLLLCEPSTHSTASDINHEDIEKLLSDNKGPRCIDTKDLLIYEGKQKFTSKSKIFFFYIREASVIS